MPEIYDPLNLIELDPVVLSAAQEERVAAKKKGGASSSKAPSEPKEMKKQKEVVAAMAETPQELPPPPSPEELRVMLDKIGAYKERFPNLKSRNKKLSTPEEIEDELHYIQLQLGSSTQSGNSRRCRTLHGDGMPRALDLEPSTRQPTEPRPARPRRAVTKQNQLSRTCTGI